MRWGTQNRQRVAGLAAFAAAILAAFAVPLLELIRLACHSRLHSHALLIPFISGWLVWQRRHCLPAFQSSWREGLGLLAAACLLAAVSFLRLWVGAEALSVRIAACLLALGGGWMLCLGRPAFRPVRFPLLFLLFMIPLPSGAIALLNVALQDGSAALAHWTFVAMRWPVYRAGYVLTLPGLVLEVAEECSGINSTYALFITSVLAGWMLLRSTGKRMLFVGIVLPLGIARNAFRIVSLAVLTLKVDPRVLDSPLHHNSGPIYFALSLVPLFALLVWLHWLEQRPGRKKEPEEA